MRILDLRLTRTYNDPDHCNGELLIDARYFCQTLEDTVRLDDPSTPQDEGKKIQDRTAIPAGIYRLFTRFSPKFKRRMIAVENVPGFTTILIHAGNTEEDTKGCILVGFKLNEKHHISPGTSRIAADKLFEMVSAAEADGDHVQLTIVNGF